MLLTKEYSFIFTGGHCNTIFANLSHILGFSEKEKDREFMWKSRLGWQEIRKWIYLTNGQLEDKTKSEFESW